MTSKKKNCKCVLHIILVCALTLISWHSVLAQAGSQKTPNVISYVGGEMTISGAKDSKETPVGYNVKVTINLFFKKMTIYFIDINGKSQFMEFIFPANEDLSKDDDSRLYLNGSDTYFFYDYKNRYGEIGFNLYKEGNKFMINEPWFKITKLKKK